MRDKIPMITCLAWSLILIAADGRADELAYPVQFAPPEVISLPAGTVLAIPGTRLAGRPGAPLLPEQAISFALPFGHQVASVRLERVRTEVLPKAYLLAPAARPFPLSHPERARQAMPDPAVYQSDTPFPGSWIQAQPVQFKFGYAALPVVIHPLSYRPASGQVIRLVSATLVVTTRPGGVPSPLYRAEAADREELAQRLQVIAPLYGYPNTAARKGDLRLPPGAFAYLIVTPAQLAGIGTANSLEALRDAKIALGMTARIETLEWIRQNYPGVRPDGGSDDGTRIRDFLIDAYGEWGTRYVLLVGDADAGDVGGESGDDLLQARKFYINLGVDPETGEEMFGNIPADLYYACLDGTFDLNANGVYGEEGDGLDFQAELQVGRLPADSTVEVEHFVRKTLAYQNAQGNWLKEAWMVGEMLWEDPLTFGGDCMDELIHGTGSTIGFDSEPFYLTHTLYDRDIWPQQWGPYDLIPILNSGPHLVNHLGHSDVNYNMRLDTGMVENLENPNVFFVYSQGCLAGAFDNHEPDEYGEWITQEDSMAEHFVLEANGAFAVVMNSRYGFGSLGGTDGPSQAFHRPFWDGFFAQGLNTLGAMLNYSKEFNQTSMDWDPYMRWVGFELNLHGDPALAIKRNINTDQPLLGIYPRNLFFSSILGSGAPQPSTLRVQNDGVGTVTYQATADQPWITITPASGTASQDVQIGIDPSALGVGTYTGTITVTSPEAANGPIQVAVTYHLVTVPSIHIPHQGTAPVVDGVIGPDEYPNALVMPIDFAGTGDVMLTLTVAGNNLYLAVDNKLATKTDPVYGAGFYFDADNNGVWPTSPGDDGVYVALQDPGAGYVNLFESFYNPGSGAQMGDWEMDPPGFVSATGFTDHRVFELAVDLTASHLAAGPEGSFAWWVLAIEFQGQDSVPLGMWPLDVPSFDTQAYFGQVDLENVQPGLVPDPLSLAFSSVVGRELPDARSLLIRETAGAALPITATTSASWLKVAPAADQTPATFSVSVDPAGLAAGTHQGEVLFANDQVWNNPLPVPVTYELLPPPAFLVVAPTSFELTAALDGPDPQPVLSVHNTGGRPLQLTLTPDVPWLVPHPDAAIIAPNASDAIPLQIMLNQLSVGDFTAQLQAAGLEAEGSPISVPLTVHVVAGGAVPPVTDLSIARQDGALQIIWQLPDDPLVVGVRVRRAVGTPPRGPEQGDGRYDGLGTEFLDQPLQNGTLYCYAVYAYDAAGRYSEAASRCSTPGVNHPPPVPIHLSPADGASLKSAPILAVQAVDDPDGDPVHYAFQVLPESGEEVLQSGAGELNGGQVNFRLEAGLEGGKAYRWRAQAADDLEATEGFSTPWSFTLAMAADGGGSDGGDHPHEGDGCGCASKGGAPAFSPALLLLFGLLFLKRRQN